LVNKNIHLLLTLISEPHFLWHTIFQAKIFLPERNLLLLTSFSLKEINISIIGNLKQV